VWGLNNNGDWFWVDGICRRQLMDKNIDDLFRLAQEWSPQSVGIEVTGQQGGFIPWIQDEMLSRNTFFNLASENNKTKPGIRPNTNKMVRFNIVVPLFKQGKMYFPTDMQQTPIMVEAMDELRLASPAGFKSKHDDFIDTISMLSSLVTWRPTDLGTMSEKSDGMWTIDEPDVFENALSSYIV